MFQISRAAIFDGDDTLWKAQILYDRAIIEFGDLMADLGFDRNLARKKLEKIDVANVDKYGFSMDRFPQSMMDTYEVLCTQYDQEVDDAILLEAQRIGYSVFRQTPEPMDGVRETLEQLQHHVRLYFYSGGVPNMQLRKLQNLNLDCYFEATYIVDRKSESELQRILHEQALAIEETWMIGNSLKSDINPALRLGMRSIWVHSRSWRYDNQPPESGKLWHVSNLLEIPPIILKAQ